MAGSNNIDYGRLRELVLAGLKDAGGPFTPRGLSLVASDKKNPDLVRNFLADGTEPLIKNVIGLCAALDAPLAEVVSGATGAEVPAKEWLLVNGHIEAGSWVEQTDWGPSDLYEIEVEADPASERHHGLLVRGRSMDKVFPPGTVLRCAELISGSYDWSDGDYVIVERKRAGLVELTCKLLTRRRDGSWELVAESYLDKFKTPIPIGKPTRQTSGAGFDGISDDETRVRAVVIDAYPPMRNRRRRPYKASGYVN